MAGSSASHLFVTWWGGGNIHPLVALGAELVDRGHRVRVLGTPGLEGRFEFEGIAFRPLGGSDLADDVVAEARREPTDLLLVDYMQPEALCAAESVDLPSVAFVHTLYASQAVGAFSPMQVWTDLARINAVRAELALPAVERVPELLDRVDLALVTTLREVDAPDGPVPDNVRYVGPLVEGPGPDTGWTPPWPAGDTPLVVVGMGTTPMDEAPVLQRVLDALADAPVHVFATVGDHLDPDAVTAPANAIVTRSVRHAAVFPHAALFVTHAGMSGIGTALTFGVPMLCLPLGREQPDNAAHVAAAGAGRALDRDAPADAIRAAVLDMLADAAYRTHAEELAAAIRRDGGARRAADELEALLQTR